MRNTLTTCRAGLFLLGWLWLQVFGQFVVCYGHDGHLAVEPAGLGHCDMQVEAGAPHDGDTLVAPEGCRDKRLLTGAPKSAPAKSGAAVVARPVVRSREIGAVAGERPSPRTTVPPHGPPHLSDLRSVMLRC